MFSNWSVLENSLIFIIFTLERTNVWIEIIIRLGWSEKVLRLLSLIESMIAFNI